MEEDLIFAKATLALGGGVRLPAGLVLPVRISHSTAGPGAGNDSAVFAFGGLRVKKAVSYERGDFELHDLGNGRYGLTHQGQPFLNDVRIEPVVFHSPEQAFFTLDQRCIYRCAFCASPRLGESAYKGYSDAAMVAMTLEVAKMHPVRAIALTSGVVGSVQATVDRFVSCVQAFRTAFPDTPIGIEPYVDTRAQIEALKAAGADEIKLNLQSPSRAVFSRVCPDLSYDNILQCLCWAVAVFGRGKVTSNVIFGMGESDEDLRQTMELLCGLGVIPTVRPLRYNNYNRESLAKAMVDPEPVAPARMIAVAKMQKEIMLHYGLTTQTCQTMCLACRCCDLVPFKDF